MSNLPKTKIDKNKAIKNLEDLGLSSYEAKTFIALHRLGRGTAREIYRVSDVPRSQIYGAAEQLEKKGLIEIQRSKPMKFRPVGIDEAEKKLDQEFKHKKQTALSYVENVQSDLFDETEEKEDVWTIHGYETVTRRIIEIIQDAREYIIISISRENLFSEEIIEKTKEKSKEGVKINILTNNQESPTKFNGNKNIKLVKTPKNIQRKDTGGRVVVADGDTTLLSVINQKKEIHQPEYESAIWSQKTGFSKVLVQMIESWLDGMIPK
ncbi:Sugar-specific transcriptional regulator TrmB [Methanonatronarchaeum thermophilum]|uniref:Sugar-specific transcriptional regulator TrmB n=1 Tax=Methanonatronarchaeum thermophilum TaxID=1927129 RepID=A0A1Y3GHP5_9EURY|nr:helix-turn-helix domain-containing protein [Methanonatronarchaeum thermophilum]OUJ18955.1 Sugar-specific transcriptional regulator TrmB [Methanonatronarchaeum thermophilum]